MTKSDVIEAVSFNAIHNLPLIKAWIIESRMDITVLWRY
jgi:hypothetical protein